MSIKAARRAQEAYVEVLRWSEPGDDEIYLLGMSRGMLGVRTLAGLLTERGLVDPRSYRTEAGLRRMVRSTYGRHSVGAQADEPIRTRGIRALLLGTGSLPLRRRAKALSAYVLSQLAARHSRARG
jgi:uncharacterized protein (DUF2235 family)